MLDAAIQQARADLDAIVKRAAAEYLAPGQEVEVDKLVGALAESVPLVRFLSDVTTRDRPAVAALLGSVLTTALAGGPGAPEAAAQLAAVGLADPRGCVT